MLMSEFDAVTEDVLDAMAEMANMIFGNVKTELEEQLGGLGLSIPTVIFGPTSPLEVSGTILDRRPHVSAGTDILELKICLVKSHDQNNSSRSQMRPYSLLREEA